MRTEDLIRALAADGSQPVAPIGRTLWRAVGVGALLSTTLFLLVLHPRPDIRHALLTVPFDFKLAVAHGVGGHTIAVRSLNAARLSEVNASEKLTHNKNVSAFD